MQKWEVKWKHFSKKDINTQKERKGGLNLPKRSIVRWRLVLWQLLRSPDSNGVIVDRCVIYSRPAEIFYLGRNLSLTRTHPHQRPHTPSRPHTHTHTFQDGISNGQIYLGKSYIIFHLNILSIHFHSQVDTCICRFCEFQSTFTKCKDIWLEKLFCFISNCKFLFKYRKI